MWLKVFSRVRCLVNETVRSCNVVPVWKETHSKHPVLFLTVSRSSVCVQSVVTVDVSAEVLFLDSCPQGPGLSVLWPPKMETVRQYH